MSTVRTSGNPATAKLMIIYPHPSEDDLDTNGLLSDSSGTMVWTWLGFNKVNKTECYVVTCINELPASPNGKDITDLQFGRAWEDFDMAVSAFQGTCAICIGKESLWRFTGLSGGIDSWRGYMVEPTDAIPLTRIAIKETVYKTGAKKGQAKIEKHREVAEPACVNPPNLKLIIPTLEPKVIMRMQNTVLPAFAADIARAVRGIDNWNSMLTQDAFTRANFNMGSVRDSLTGEEGVVSFDIEGYNHITDISFCANDGVPHSMRWNAESRELSNSLLTDNNLIKVAHNAAFDMHKLAQDGVRITGKVADTMLMAAMLEPDMPKGLKYIAPIYLDIKRWDHLQSSDMAFYNAMDAKYTVQLFNKFRTMLEQRDQYDLFMNIIMRCVPTLIRLSDTGLKVSNRRKSEWLRELGDKLMNLSLEWAELTGGIDWSKPMRMKNYLKSLGMVMQYSNKGTETLNENAIRKLMFEYPDHKKMLELLLDLRRTSKQISTYAEIEVTSDSTVHPSYLPAGKDDDKYDEDGDSLGKGLAGTWRPTAKDPPIQQQPKEARKLFVPRTDGHVFVEMDYNAFEARILAALAKDARLQEAIDDNLHVRNANALNVDKTRAKNGFYGWSYGAGPRTLKDTFRTKGYDVSFAQCKKLLNDFDELYGASARYRNSLIQVTKQTRVVTNPFGLKRFFYAREIGTAPCNTMIQSTAAIIMWKILPELEAEAVRQGGRMVAMVHDSVEFEMPADFDREPFRRIMEQEFPEVAPGFRVPIDIKVGPSWGEVA
jgi:DNA polymerase I-like protein with 3'-5' exonuclease and polymerase domains